MAPISEWMEQCGKKVKKVLENAGMVRDACLPDNKRTSGESGIRTRSQTVNKGLNRATVSKFSPCKYSKTRKTDFK
jgi:hypothetical protein